MPIILPLSSKAFFFLKDPIFFNKVGFSGPYLTLGCIACIGFQNLYLYPFIIIIIFYYLYNV